MKRCIFSIALASSFAAMSMAAEVQRVEGEILVKFKPSGAAMADTYHRQIGATAVGSLTEIGVQRVKLPAGVSVDKAVAYYQRLAAVEYAESNNIYKKTASVNDPLYSRQYSPARMKVDTAWDLSNGSNTIVVGVLDTGVDYNHVDLSGKVTKGKDWAENDNDPMDVEGHGTHVAGIIGAKTNNGVGIAGIGYNVSIYAVRVLGPGGGTAEWISGGILEAADKGVDIINLSLGGAGNSKAIEDAVNYAWNKGVLVVAAAGNDGVTTRFYPAAYENALAVAATDKNDFRSSFSNYGADWVDVAAPGTGILSTVPNNGYEEYDGTSMAAPNVSGVASLAMAYAGKGIMTNAEVRNLLETTAVPVGSFVAKGRVNAYAAVSLALPPIVTVTKPATATMFDGTTYSGTAASLSANEGQYFSVSSRFVSQLGGVAATEFTVPYGFPASRYMSGKLTFRSKATLNSTATVYMKRNDGQYDVLKSYALSGSDITRSLFLPTSISNYLSGGKLTFVIRSVLPYRYGSGTYTHAMDSVSLEMKTSSKNLTP